MPEKGAVKMNIRKALGKIYWNVRYIYKYVIVNHKFGRVGLKSDIRKPLRICGGKRVFIGDRCFIMDGIRIEAVTEWGGVKRFSPEIYIKNDVQIQQNCHITCANHISIGEGTCILPHVLITDIEHEHFPDKSPAQTGLITGGVTIGKYVSIGMGARIIGKKPIIIGDNAVIGTSAVVTKDVPKGAVMAGIPAEIIGWNKDRV